VVRRKDGTMQERYTGKLNVEITYCVI